MYKIQKRFTFPMGHRLSLHKGACSNWHGHNITVIVGLKSRTLNENGMVIDFSDLSNLVGLVIDKWDHALLLNKTDYKILREDIDIDKAFNKLFKIYSFDFEPTAENLSRVIYEELTQQLNGYLAGTDKNQQLVVVDFIEFWENEKAMVRYEKDTDAFNF